MKSEHQIRVEEFMRKAEQELPSGPSMPSQYIRTLRARLILEEALETVQALGVAVHLESSYGLVGVYIAGLRYFSAGDHDLVEAVDGCCDLRVVTTGTLSALGVQDESVQKIVDDANLRKFGPGSYKDVDGKWIKPPDFVPPQEALVLELQQQAQAARV